MERQYGPDQYQQPRAIPFGPARRVLPAPREGAGVLADTSVGLALRSAGARRLPFTWS
jgi:hypothetical protein